MIKKYIKDFVVVSNEWLNERHVLMKLRPKEGELPQMRPGQFVQVRADGARDTFLRLPISINNVEREKGLLWLMVQVVGEGTKALSRLKAGDIVNLVLPLGNGFTTEGLRGRMLLVGGGVGTAPMLMLGRTLKDKGLDITFLLGARTRDAVLERELFENIAPLLITTEDGTLGERGFVTQHSALQSQHFDHIFVCGPKPMMMAVAKYAKGKGVTCEVSLENMMACGLGACLCCVEKTVRGNVCVCQEGPVFNINELTWQI